MPKTLLLVFTLLFWSVQVSAQMPERWTEPVPLSTGEGEAGETNANRILFFRHPAVPDSAGNFQQSPSLIEYGARLEETAFDLVGAPGFPPSEGSAENIGDLLADPAGLCFDDYLLRLLCHRDWLVGGGRHQPSWQVLLADLRNAREGEAHPGLAPEVTQVVLDGSRFAAPYSEYGLSPLIAAPGDQLETSPPAVCYDIAAAEDWIACPVFGKIYVRGYTDLRSGVIPHGEPVEVQSPVVIFRQGDDRRYHLAGYLANPLNPLQYDLYDVIGSGPTVAPNPDRRIRQHNVHFPMAIAASNFGLRTDVDIAVMGTATLPYILCKQYLDRMEDAGITDFPWKRNCTRGLVWFRVEAGWEKPVRELFDTTRVLLGAPKIYSMAAGRDGDAAHLFAASNAPDRQGRFYVLKYLERISIPSTLRGEGDLAPPRPIPVRQLPGDEAGEFGPFKIITGDFNEDLWTDFAITWKKTQDRLADTENRIWKGTYASYFSLFLARQEGEQVEYVQHDYEVPGSELAAITFGEKEGEKYLVVGDNKRRQTAEGEYHAFAHVFPVPGGIVNNLNGREVKVSFFPGNNAETPGVGDLTTSPESHVIAAALRNPFLPAPEVCDRGSVESGNGVYGHLWLGEVQTTGGTNYFLDADNDGVPNRCEPCALGADPGSPDADHDELPDVAGCDFCRSEPDTDFDRDGILGCVDNCPAVFNPEQTNADGDNAGDECDECSGADHLPGRTRRGVYFHATTSEDCLNPTCFDDDAELVYCEACANGFIAHRHFDYRFGAETYPIMPGNHVSYGRDLDCNSSDDWDRDGIPDPRDNCVYGRNSDQADFDGDGSGDLCDPPSRGGCGEGDDCDNDGVPNRFDRLPFNPDVSWKQPDTIYDPRAPYIADRKELRPAQFYPLEAVTDDDATNVDLDQIQRREELMLDMRDDISGTFPDLRDDPFPLPGTFVTPRCGYFENTWPGPRGGSGCEPLRGGEVTVVLPSQTEPPCEVGIDPECRVDCDPETGVGCPPCDPGTDPECTEPPTTGRNVVQYCVAHSRIALTAFEQEAIDKANKEIAAITGLENFDILVGSEAGVIHYECALLGGAYQTEDGEGAARGLSLPRPGGSPPPAYTALAPYALFQTAGLPPHIQYDARPDPALAIARPHALVIGPVPSPGDEGALPSLALPSLGAALPPDRSEVTQVPAERVVQWSQQGQNVNGRLIYQILTPNQAVSAGMSLSVGPLYSVFSMDVKAPPEPFSEVPVEAREDKIELLISKLKEKAEIWRREGRDTRTPEIYVGLPWEKPMAMEFHLVQNTLPEAVSAAKAADPSLARNEEFDEGFVHHLVLPAYVKAPRAEIVGGCGCNLPGREFSILSLLYLLCLLTPVPVLLYYRNRKRTRK